MIVNRAEYLEYHESMADLRQGQRSAPREMGNRCSRCGYEFFTLEDEYGQHSCPNCALGEDNDRDWGMETEHREVW